MTNTTAEEDASRKLWLVPVLTCMTGTLMANISSSIINVALLTIKGTFGTDFDTVEWIVTIYSISLGIVIPLSGWMAQRMGLKRLYMTALAVFTVGSLFCAVSWNIDVLIAMRVVQAFGGGMMLPTGMAIIKYVVPRKDYGTAMGIYGISILMGPALGPTLGGFLVEYAHWRWTFMVNLPLGVLGLVLARLTLPSFPPSHWARLDIKGAITSTVMLFCLLLALSKGGDWGWTSEPIVLLLYVSGVFFVLFLSFELTSRNPLLELRLFRYRSFTIANVISVSVQVGMYSVGYFLPIFLQSLRGMGAMQAGMLMFPGGFVAGLMMPVVGRMYDKIEPWILAVFGLLGLAASTYLFSAISMETSTGVIIFWLVIRYFCLAFAQMPAQTASIEAVPLEMAGQASALSSLISRVSSSFGLAILTTLMNGREAFHQVRLEETLTSDNQALQGTLQSFQTLDVLRGLIQQTAFVKSLDDILFLTAIATAVTIIPAFFLKRGRDR